MPQTVQWRMRLPELRGSSVTVRQLRQADAGPLLRLLADDDVSRFISAPPRTLDEFARFVRWSNRQRRDGAYATFAVVPRGDDRAVGLIQVRQLEPKFDTAEWGFALGAPYWGTGIFPEAAALVRGFARETLGTRRLEARAVVHNARGNAALRKIGATWEGTLRRSFFKHGEFMDQHLWAMLW